MNRPRLFRADWVLPVEAAPIRDGGVLVGPDGRILEIGETASLPTLPDAEIVELPGCVLLPGLVNVHAHPDLAMFRGALEDLPFRDWIGGLRMKTGALGPADHLAAARWTAVEAIRAGMTTLAATEATAAALPALVEAGLRGVVYQEVFGPDPRQAEAATTELRIRLAELLESATDLVRVGVSPHAPFSASDDLFRRATELALAERLPIAVHIGESADERLLVAAGEGGFATLLRARGIATPCRGRSPVAMLDRLGVLSARPLLIHCVDVDEEDVRLIAGADCSVAHCPVANAKLGHGAAPVTSMLGAGVHVGIGTDSVASNNRLDLLEEARFAALIQRARHHSPDLLPAAELLELCTLGGARALGLEHSIGSLRPGKDADLCAVSLRGVHTRPVHDPVAALFHSARGADVVLTVVRGRILFGGERVLTLDEESAGRDIDAVAARMQTSR